MNERYSHSKHGAKLSDWLQARGIPVPPLEFFSSIGWVVDDIAAGFLFLTRDSKQCYIDHVVTDYDTTAPVRDKALVKLIELLVDDARTAGCRMVTVLASLPPMKKRFERLGFRAHGDYTLFYREVSEGAKTCLG